MLRIFEQLINPFPSEEPAQRLKGFFAFCHHYTKGAEKHLIIMALLTAVLAILEVLLFDFLGQLVDWLGSKNPETFLQEEGTTLLWMSLIVLIAIPVTVLLHSIWVHQVLLSHYPMAIRWSMHRYLLRQSYTFYQNEFAGRIATKVLQTALAVRESVMKVLDVFLFVSVYFTGMLFLVVSADWRLMLPLFLVSFLCADVVLFLFLVCVIFQPSKPMLVR